MSEDPRPPGLTTIAPDVLIAIARLTTLNVEGVSHMNPAPGGVNRLLKRGHQGEGVFIEIHEDVVGVDIYVVMNNGVNIRKVSREIQEDVSRAISEMVGMQVGQINVHIEDIFFPPEE
ncbi:MAG: Asp23/Gls24 family envelope stress response protein [Anaerolineales bacterium]|nr:Asp23/Gls24 family envelope stress response protein [Anaerolineales bacterium]